MKTLTSIGRAAAIAAILAGASAPAFAADVKMTYNAKTDKYCYQATATGSRLAKTVCMTREQLAAAGIKVPARSEAVLAKR